MLYRYQRPDAGRITSRVLPFSVLFGANFLIWADIIARVVMVPEHMAIGVVTGLTAGLFLI